MQEFQERNVFFDSTPMPDAEDFCRCRDWCVENYDLTVWQAQGAAGKQEAVEEAIEAQEQQIAQCAADDAISLIVQENAQESVQMQASPQFEMPPQMPLQAPEAEELAMQAPENAFVAASPAPVRAPIPTCKPCGCRGGRAVNTMFDTSYNMPAQRPAPVPSFMAPTDLEVQIPADTLLQTAGVQPATLNIEIDDVDNMSGYEQELLHL